MSVPRWHEGVGSPWTASCRVASCILLPASAMTSSYGVARPGCLTTAMLRQRPRTSKSPYTERSNSTTLSAQDIVDALTCIRKMVSGLKLLSTTTVSGTFGTWLQTMAHRERCQRLCRSIPTVSTAMRRGCRRHSPKLETSMTDRRSDRVE